MTDSRPPRSTNSPQSPTGVSEALAQIRVYKDDAALDRVWNRLDTQRRRSPMLAPAARAAVSAALVAAGVFVGIVYERQRLSDGAVAAVVSSEVIATPESAAGPTTDGPRFAAPERDAADEQERKSRVRRRVQRLSSPVRPTSDASKETAEEIVPPTAEEPVALLPKAEWVVLVERGEYAASYQQLEESGGFDGVLQSGSSEELMTLVEVARYVGQQGRAIQALRAVTVRHQADPNAPIAAMILGNLLSKSGDVAGAAQAYALNRRLSPQGDFAEDALVGEFDMALAAGDVARVERLRANYEAEFPEGRHLENIRAEARRLVQRSSSFAAPRAADVADDEEQSFDEGFFDDEAEDEPESDPVPQRPSGERSNSERPHAERPVERERADDEETED